MRYHFKLLALILFAVVFSVSGCGKPGVGWKYRDSKYVTNIGTGQSQDEARSRAKEGVNLRFNQQVEDDVTRALRTEIALAGVKVSGASLEAQIRALAAQDLKEVMLVNEWTDEDTGKPMALAVVNKKDARKAWLEEIVSLEKRMDDTYAKAEATGNKFSQLAGMQAVLNLWLEKEAVISRLKTIGYTKDIPRGFNIKDVFTKIVAIRSQLPVYVTVSGEYGDNLRDRITSDLLNAGFLAAQNREDAEVLVSGSIDVQPVTVDDPGWRFARAVVTLSIVDPKAGLSVWQVTDDTRAAHATYPEAVLKALKKIAPKISRQLLQRLELGR